MHSDHVLLVPKRIYYWMECKDVTVCRVIYTTFPLTLYYKKKKQLAATYRKRVHFLCTSCVEYNKNL